MLFSTVCCKVVKLALQKEERNQETQTDLTEKTSRETAIILCYIRTLQTLYTKITECHCLTCCSLIFPNPGTSCEQYATLPPDAAVLHCINTATSWFTVCSHGSQSIEMPFSVFRIKIFPKFSIYATVRMTLASRLVLPLFVVYWHSVRRREGRDSF